MTTTDPGQPVVASSTLGAIGRFGNQVLQYGFLRIYAARHGLGLETPEWIGRELFGCCEAPVTPGRPVVTELELGLFGADFETRPAAVGADVWGWFQVDARTLAPQRDLFRSLFRLQPPFAAELAAAEARLRAGGRTLVGLHLRRGDYRGASGHPLVDRLYQSTPTSHYREWLEHLWPTLERPVLYVASDGTDSEGEELAPYRPVTARTLGLAFASVPFLPDFFLLSRCAAMAISNSTFSFAAALLAEPNATFVRPVAASGRLERFSPWASPPHLAAEPASALERAEPERFEAGVAAQPTWPVALRLTAVSGRSPVAAILSGRPHRGWLEFRAELPEDRRAAATVVRWRDADEDEASFEFASRELQLFHGDDPPNFAGFGRASGARLDGPAWSLLAAAEVPGRPGELFVALTLLSSGPHSFFIEVRCRGELRRAAGAQGRGRG